MAFAVSGKDRNAAEAVRRIARERLSASLFRLDDPGRHRAETVHELRKNIKKTRAVLRLVRPNFNHYARENAALRDTARLVSDLRDVDVLAETFDRVAARTHLPPPLLADLRARLIVPKGADDDADGALRAYISAVSDIHKRAKRWKIAGDGFAAFEGGLERSWTAAQKAMRQAEKDPTGETLHRWRKRVKDHWYHARLLHPIWAEMMQPHVEAAGTLGETLGEARDLALLVETLSGVKDAADIRAAAREEETRLLADAYRLGTRFLAEPATCLSGRCRSWWDVWRADQATRSPASALSTSATVSSTP